MQNIITFTAEMDKAPGSDAIGTASSATAISGRFVNIRRQLKQDLNNPRYAMALSKLKGGLNLEYTIMDSTDSPGVLDVVVTEYAVLVDKVSRINSSAKKREISFLNGQVYEEKLYVGEHTVYIGQKINDRIIIKYFNTEISKTPYKAYICDMSMNVKQINSHGGYYSDNWNHYTIIINDSTTPPTVTETLVKGSGETLDFEIARGMKPIFPLGFGLEYLI
jgi:hypothetical protein